MAILPVRNTQPNQSTTLAPQAGGAGSASAASSNTTSQGGSGNVNFAQSTASSEAKGESGGSGGSSGGGSSGGSSGGGGGGGGYDIGASLAMSDQTDTSQQQRLGISFGGVGQSDTIGAMSVFGNAFAPGATIAGSGPTGGGPIGDSSGTTSTNDTLLWVSIGIGAIGLLAFLYFQTRH